MQLACSETSHSGLVLQRIYPWIRSLRRRYPESTEEGSNQCTGTGSETAMRVISRLRSQTRCPLF